MIEYIKRIWRLCSMEIVNYSLEKYEQVVLMLPQKLLAEKVIIFPDICKVDWRIPTGVVILTKQVDWREYAISDIGCGMLLCKSQIKADTFDKSLWDEVLIKLKNEGGKCGDLASGNHFVDAIKSQKDGYLYFLIHCGAYKNVEKLETCVRRYNEFDRYYNFIFNQAKENRYHIYEILKTVFGNIECIFDKSHNSIERTDDGVIIRRGAVKVQNDELSVIPSSLCGEIALVRASNSTLKTLFSLCHGTGRTIGRDEVIKCQNDIDYNSVRNKVYIPHEIKNESLKMDMPCCYKDLESCLALIHDFVELEDKYSVVGYLGHIG
jgi:hypothetical protein